MGEILKPPLPANDKERYTFETRGTTAKEDEADMIVSRQVDLLEPIDLAEHLGKVELYLGQVCQIAGISKMQLDYWTNKAQIPTKGKKQRIYDIDALETVMLIKQAKDKGLNLGAAIDAARRFREVQSAEPRLREDA
jgi:MerR HTH family regulatory protein